MKRKTLLAPATDRLGAMLIVAFAATVTSFMFTTSIVRMKARGIGAAAEALAASALPSLEALTRMRTLLHSMQMDLDAQPSSLSDEEQTMTRATAALTDDWRDYLALPNEAEEKAAQPEATAAVAAVEAAIERVGTAAPERRELSQRQAKEAVERLDEQLAALIALNGHRSSELARDIIDTRASTRWLSDVLHLVCTVFTVMTALAVVRIVRRQASLMEERVSDLDHFATRLAHDIRTPLGTVGLAVGIAEQSPSLEPNVRQALARATSTLAQVRQVVDGLLAMAQKGPTEEMAHVELDPVFVAVVGLFQPEAQRAGIDLQLEKPVGCSVACTAGVVISILSNLVGNAIKHMGAARERRISVRAKSIERARVRIEVEDTGPGIARSKQDRIFELFVRGDSSKPGFGVGLATVRRLAEAHDGGSGVESSEGAGCVFWVELPAASPG